MRNTIQVHHLKVALIWHAKHKLSIQNKLLNVFNDMQEHYPEAASISHATTNPA